MLPLMLMLLLLLHQNQTRPEASPSTPSRVALFCPGGWVDCSVQECQSIKERIYQTTHFKQRCPWVRYRTVLIISARRVDEEVAHCSETERLEASEMMLQSPAHLVCRESPDPQMPISGVTDSSILQTFVTNGAPAPIVITDGRVSWRMARCKQSTSC